MDEAIERIRQSLADLDSPEAAPRLNAQVRLREEHVEMLKLVLAELDRTNDTLGNYAMNCRRATTRGGCW